METNEMRTSALQNLPLEDDSPRLYLYSFVLRKQKFLTRNWLLILSSITEWLKAISFYPYSPAESWQKSALFRTVSKTWDLQYFSSRSLLFLLLVISLYNSTNPLKDFQHIRFWLKHHDVALISTFTPFLRAAAFLFFFAHLWTTKSFLYHKNVFIKSVSAFSLFLVFCIL